MLVLATVQTADEGKPAPDIRPNLSLEMEHSDRGGALAIRIFIRGLDLPTHRLPLLPTVQLRNTFRKDVNSRFSEHPRRSADFMAVNQFCGWFSGDEEVIRFGLNPQKFFKGLYRDLFRFYELSGDDAEDDFVIHFNYDNSETQSLQRGHRLAHQNHAQFVVLQLLAAESSAASVG